MVSDTGRHAIRLFRPTADDVRKEADVLEENTAKLDLFAGSGIKGFADGVGKAARFDKPLGMRVSGEEKTVGQKYRKRK